MTGDETLTIMRHLTLSNEAEIMNTVRKWGLNFNGSGNPMEFLKRLSELTECYHISPLDVIRALLEIFRGTELEWLRIRRSSFTSWHRKGSCRRPYRLFCSFCGTDNHLSRIARVINIPLMLLTLGRGATPELSFRSVSTMKYFRH